VKHFAEREWQLYDADWIEKGLEMMIGKKSYENDVAGYCG